MISFFKLIRYKNLLLIFLTMILTQYAVLNPTVKTIYFFDFQFLILSLAVILIAASGNIVNDIYDIEADQINKPNKVYIGKCISKKNAWYSYFGLTTLGLITGLYISFSVKIEYSLIFIFSIFGLFFYSIYLKKMLIIGNLLISFFCVLPILIPYLFVHFKSINNEDQEQVYLYIIVYSFFAFVTTLIREIIKDIEDINGDLKLKAKTLPIVLGRTRAKKMASFISILLLFLFIQISKNYLYHFPVLLGYSFVFILVPLAYFTYKLWQATTTKEFHFLSSFMKIIMLFGILSMVLFKFI